jgi:hypothetical protein
MQKQLPGIVHRKAVGWWLSEILDWHCLSRFGEFFVNARQGHIFAELFWLASTLATPSHSSIHTKKF